MDFGPGDWASMGPGWHLYGCHFGAGKQQSHQLEPDWAAPFLGCIKAKAVSGCGTCLRTAAGGGDGAPCLRPEASMLSHSQLPR